MSLPKVGGWCCVAAGSLIRYIIMDSSPVGECLPNSISLESCIGRPILAD
ncbi:MAG: hypothetical protein ACKO5E_06010 [bacterium]